MARKRDKDKLLKLLGKQRKDNILLKKLLSVQIEKERVRRIFHDLEAPLRNEQTR